MKVERMIELFDNSEDKEFLRFERVKNKLSNCPDIHAFILLENLCPPKKGEDMVGSASHDEIYLNVDVDKLADVITVEQIIDLVRCGVRYDESCGSLAMFT